MAIGPDDRAAFQRYFASAGLPFLGVPDPGGETLRRLGQEVNWLKFGRLPALLALARDGEVHQLHHARSVRDLPDFEAAAQTLVGIGT